MIYSRQTAASWGCCLGGTFTSTVCGGAPLRAIRQAHQAHPYILYCRVAPIHGPSIHIAVDGHSLNLVASVMTEMSKVSMPFVHKSTCWRSGCFAE